MPTIVKPGTTTPSAATVLWQSLNPIVTETGSVVSGHPAINLIDPATWSTWIGAGSGRAAVYDFGIPAVCSGFGIAAHNIGSQAANYAVQYSSDGSSWITIHTETPLTDDDIFCVFPSVTARYWRLYFASAPASVGVFVVGGRLVFPHAPVAGYKPLHHARQYVKMFNDSIGGQFLGTRVMSVGAETEVNMGFFDRSWLEANIRPFETHYNQGGTFMYASSPSLYPLDVGYCRAKGENDTLNIEWTEADKMATLDFGVRSYVGG